MKDEDIKVTVRLTIRPGWEWVVWAYAIIATATIVGFGVWVFLHLKG